MSTAAGRVEFDPYLPLRDLSGYSGLGVRTLRGYLVHASHPLPHYRMAGKILVKRSEFDRWMQEYRREVPSCVDAIVDDVLKSKA
jgi:Helix-turn-helix domain